MGNSISIDCMTVRCFFYAYLISILCELPHFTASILWVLPMEHYNVTGHLGYADHHHAWAATRIATQFFATRRQYAG